MRLLQALLCLHFIFVLVYVFYPVVRSLGCFEKAPFAGVSVSCVSLCFLFTLLVYVFSCPVVMGLWRLLPAFLFFFYLLFIFTPAGIPVFASFYTLNSLVLSFYTFSLRFSFLFYTLLVYLFSCPVVMGLWCFELAPFAGIYFTCISIL